MSKGVADDTCTMKTEASPIQPAPRRHERCAYIKCCYLADALGCYGFKADCALYRRSNGEEALDADFNRAMDDLIDRVRARAQRLVD